MNAVYSSQKYSISNERLMQGNNSMNTEKNKRVKASATSTQQPRIVPGVPKVLASPVSLDCPFLIAPSVFSNAYIVRYWIYLSYNKILITVTFVSLSQVLQKMPILSVLVVVILTIPYVCGDEGGPRWCGGELVSMLELVCGGQYFGVLDRSKRKCFTHKTFLIRVWWK